MVIGCVYIPPNSSFAFYRVSVIHVRIYAMDFQIKFSIFGDFNLPKVKWTFEDDVLVPSEVNSPCVEVTVDTMCFLELQQINEIQNVYGKSLDLIFADDFKKSKTFISKSLRLPTDSQYPSICTYNMLDHFESYHGYC